ncbi:MAG: leucine-rich repeat domain-containing protein [Cyanobacteria bacterium P01_G01_bin.54]
MQSLNLSGNKLTELPEWLGQLTQLKELSFGNDFGGNQLKELPECLGQLTHLQSLYLSSNKLEELPEWLVQLTHLQLLNLSSNKLTELPEWLGQLKGLQSLSLSENQLKKLPEWLGQLTYLQSLYLSHNQLKELPDSLGQLTQLQVLYLSHNQLKELSESLGQLKRLQLLHLSHNQVKELPESLGQLKRLQSLKLFKNQLKELPDSLGQLTQLQLLYLSHNQLEELPESLGQLKKLQVLQLQLTPLVYLPKSIGECEDLRVIELSQILPNGRLKFIPSSIGKLKNLEVLGLKANQLSTIPESIVELPRLRDLNLAYNPLNPELAAACEQGLDAVKAYLRAKAEAQIILNEAKLILIGEGEVGKSCLLDALRNEPWQKHESTHGIEIKPVKVTHQDEQGTETAITLNTWDFGGQKVYRPTHQFFFSAPAVYLVVWKPREGPQQGAVDYWINTIKHRAGSEAKLLIVATHGGPQQRQPDIDLQDLRDKFGADCVLNAFHVDNRPERYDEKNDTWTGERQGIAELKKAIAEVAATLPNVGRTVATSWNNVRQIVKQCSEQYPYISYMQFEELCAQENVDTVLAQTYAGMLNQLGYIIHYDDADDLKQLMILKPDWLAKAISFVLDDKKTRQRNGLISHEHLSQLWSNPPYDYEAGYPEELHPLFRKLMERFDISYQVILNPTNGKPIAASLIAQLVSDQPKPLPNWDEQPQPGDQEKRQICQIVERERNQSANAEGLFYRLIARLHKYSLGRDNYDDSVHWQRGLLLEDGYNGRALLRHIGNDIHITVRAVYPDFMLYELTKDVQELVQNPEQGWAGLRCDVMVPCIEPCGLDRPGLGLFEVGRLKESKRRGRSEYPCNRADCDEWQNIDCLLQNATVTRRSQLSDKDIRQIRDEVQEIVEVKDKKYFQRMLVKDQQDLQRMRSLYRKMSQADEQLAILMQMGLDEARNGPRLFSLTPTDTEFLDNPAWATQKFQLTLWCEHSRKPLPALWKDKRRGTYKFEKPREWLEKYSPALRIVTQTLSAMLPVIAATTKIAIPDDTYQGIERGLDVGNELFSAMLTGGEALADLSGDGILADAEQGVAKPAQNAVLRELHAFLQEQDPSFGGLVRVQNKRREFIWVHPQFKDKY